MSYGQVGGFPSAASASTVMDLFRLRAQGQMSQGRSWTDSVTWAPELLSFWFLAPGRM